MTDPIDTMRQPLPRLDLPLDVFDVLAGEDGRREYRVRADVDGRTREFRVHGEPTVVPDDTFGSAIGLDGEGARIELGPLRELLAPLDAPTAGFSVVLWIKASSLGRRHRTLIAADGLWRLGLDPARHPIFSVEGGGGPSLARAEAVRHEGDWMHLAGVHDGRRVTLFVDGVALGESADAPAGGTPPPIAAADARVLVGADASHGQRFDGQLARLKLFDRALDAAQVNAIRQADRSVQATFRERHPFAFELADDGVRDVLYVSDAGVANETTLGVVNTSGIELVLAALPDAPRFVPDATHHHLELRFRPGTFRSLAPRAGDPSDTASAPPLTVTDLPDGWRSSGTAVPAPDGLSLSVYFARVGASGATETLAPQQVLAFGLGYATADGAAGSRGTHVVLGYRGLHWDTGDGRRIDVAGERIRRIDIVNQSGKRDVPLHVGVVGSNRVLNVDAPRVPASESAGTITVRLLNTLPSIPAQPLRNHLRFRSLHAAAGANAEAATTFTVTLDVDPKDDWALTDITALDAIDMRWRSGPEGPTHSLRRDAQGRSAVWTFRPDIESLGPGEFIDIIMSGIRSTRRAGLSNVYINYEDLPGYWDGQFVAVLEKSPIVHDGEKVGIGSYPSREHHNRLQVHGGVNVVSGELTINHSGMTMNWGEGDSWQLINAAGALAFSYNGDDTVYFGESAGGGIRILERGLTIDSGRLGIGIGLDEAAAPLHVVGGSDASLSSHGFAVFGGTTGKNLVIDDNGIVARDNGRASTLYLNAEGGTVAVGGELKVGSTISAVDSLTLKGPGRDSHRVWKMQVLEGALGFVYKGKHKFYIGETTGFREVSDARLKRDVEDVTGALEIVRHLRPRRFSWRADGTPDIGFVAQEVAAVLPERVESLGGTMTLSYRDFSVLAIGAIREQQAQIEALETRVEALVGAAR